MIENILQMLNKANGETELIRFAQGKNKLPETFLKGFKQAKKEIQWQLRRQ